jgi:hypothetical protein
LKDQTEEGLAIALSKIEQSVKLPFGQPHSPFRICDLKLILSEMSEIASKDDNDRFRMILIEHESTRNILLTVFTKTYNAKTNNNISKKNTDQCGMIDVEELV